MLDLAISIDADANGTPVIETNHGTRFKSPGWPQDCESRIVAFNPSGKTCDVVWPEQLAADIHSVLETLDAADALNGRKPDWYRRLALYAKGAA